MSSPLTLADPSLRSSIHAQPISAVPQRPVPMSRRLRSGTRNTLAASGAAARQATTHAIDSHGGGAVRAMLASKTPIWPAAIVNTRVPASSRVAPAGSAGSTGIGGSGGNEPVGLGAVLGCGLRGGVADADAVAAGVVVARGLVGGALDATALVRGVGEPPGMFRSVSVPHADAIRASASIAANARFRG